jgi:hypothetical protein
MVPKKLYEHTRVVPSTNQEFPLMMFFQVVAVPSHQTLQNMHRLVSLDMLVAFLDQIELMLQRESHKLIQLLAFQHRI